MHENLIKHYFHKNFTYEEISCVLNQTHQIKISVSTIKRTLQELDLRRKKIKESKLGDIIDSVVEELFSSGYDLGYKALWLKLKTKYKLNVKRQTVYEILKIADPEGMADRYGHKLHRREYLSPGSNFSWHIDGYDKLKRYGFAIHVCVDGFLRMIIWLEVASTNNNPRVVAYYYLTALKSMQFLPTVISSDKGSENIVVEDLHICLRSKHKDKFSGGKSFVKGKSVHNQRIESSWGRMRQHSIDFYIQLFKCLESENLFDGSDLHRKCMQLCFGPLIKYVLQTTKELWNIHKIRKQPGRNNVFGKPYVLFNAPEKYDATNFKKPVDLEVLDKLINRFTIKPSLIDHTFEQYVKKIIPNVCVLATPDEAVLLYKRILNVLNESL